MINANELRIGNWLQYEDDGHFTKEKIIAIAYNMNGYEGYSLHFNGRSTTIEDFFGDGELSVKPIPLTETILFEFGFKKTDILGSYLKTTPNTTKGYGIRIHSQNPFSDDDFTKIIEVYQVDNTQLITHYWLKYVHQLQNLYFALTNEELQINL